MQSILSRALTEWDLCRDATHDTFSFRRSTGAVSAGTVSDAFRFDAASADLTLLL